jgi:uncharacterized membrane protein
MPISTLDHLSRSPKNIARSALGILFIAAALPHFFASDAELQTIPPFLPLRRTAVYISGIFELLGGIGVFIPRFQRAAGWGLAALLVIIFPANIYHAIRDMQTGKFAQMRIYHLLRAPLQGLFIWWALWSTSREQKIVATNDPSV